MRLEPRPENTLRVSAKLVTSSKIMHLSADEMEQAVSQAQIEYPALEVTERHVCLFCGALLHGHACNACGHFTQAASMMSGISIPYDIGGSSDWSASQQYYDYEDSGFSESDLDDDFDPVACIPTRETLAEILLQQLEALISLGEEPIAEQLVGNLNERGYLEISTAEIATYLNVPLARVEYALSQLQTLDPLGIGARDLRECLLIQLQALKEQVTPHPLAFTLIDRYLGQLEHGQFGDIARELKVTEQEVRQASLYIGDKLHPYPAQTYKPDMRYTRLRNEVSYMRPDVIIRSNGCEFEVELIEEKRYGFDVTVEQLGAQGNGASDATVRRYFHASGDHAKFFIECVRRRWRTLKQVAQLVADYQHEFLEKGIRYLHPLTRAEVAARLSLDEGTVSRATANKYVLLPNGRLMAFSDFFDSSLSVKDLLRELIGGEEPAKRLSDEELARLVQARGIPVARRTVTKYREDMGIGSSREREGRHI